MSTQRRTQSRKTRPATTETTRQTGRDAQLMFATDNHVEITGLFEAESDEPR